MKPLELLLALAIAVAAALMPAPWPVLAQPVVDIETSDSDLVTAKAEPAKTLPEFWKEFDKPSPGVTNFNLKAAFPVNAGKVTCQSIWLNGVERLSRNRFAGRLGNDPRDMPGKKLGDRLEFDEKQIEDWMFMRNGKIVVNQTMRPLLKKMPAAQAAQFQSMLEKP